MCKDQVEKLTARFNGLDVQFRRAGTGWPAPWRAQLLTNKAERSDYRLVAYGPTADDAIDALSVAVAEIDAGSQFPPGTVIISGGGMANA